MRERVGYMRTLVSEKERDVVRSGVEKRWSCSFPRRLLWERPRPSDVSNDAVSISQRILWTTPNQGRAIG